MREPASDEESLDRLRRLVETGIALSSDLSLGSLLRRLIEAAVGLTDAAYGALGVVDRAGTGLEQFVTCRRRTAKGRMSGPSLIVARVPSSHTTERGAVQISPANPVCPPRREPHQPQG